MPIEGVMYEASLDPGLRRPRDRPGALWPLAGMAVLVFAAATITRADADLWGHVRFGLDALRDHRLPSIDPYSFTQDRPWLNHEWLSEVQMGLAYGMGGTKGLILLKAVLAFTTFALIWSALRDVSRGAGVVIMVLVTFGTIHMTSSLRPQLWSFLCFAIVCRALVNPRKPVRRWLPLVFALWANLHGGWIVGLGVLGVWAAVSVVVERETWREWILIVASCAAATLCTPYGWRLWEFVATTVRMSRSIAEWQSLWRQPALNWLPWFAGVGAVVWLASRRSIANGPTIAVLSMLAYASARVMRIESLFVVSAAIFLAPHLAARWPVRPPAQRSRYGSIAAFAMFMIPVVAAGWIASWSLRCLPLLGAWAPDAAPVRLLAHNAGGRLVTPFDWGEYALWHLGPRLRVSMDGRRETVYSDQRIAENDAILSGAPAGLETLSRWNAEYVWLPATSVTTKTWLVLHGYRLDFSSARSFVAVRQDLPSLRTFDSADTKPDATRPTCFPG